MLQYRLCSKFFRHFFAVFSHFGDISTPICLGGMIDEAGSRKARGAEVQEMTDWGVEQWEFLKKCAQKSPMTGKVQSWGKQTQSDIFEGKE